MFLTSQAASQHRQSRKLWWGGDRGCGDRRGTSDVGEQGVRADFAITPHIQPFKQWQNQAKESARHPLRDSKELHHSASRSEWPWHHLSSLKGSGEVPNLASQPGPPCAGNRPSVTASNCSRQKLLPKWVGQELTAQGLPTGKKCGLFPQITCSLLPAPCSRGPFKLHRVLLSVHLLSCACWSEQKMRLRDVHRSFCLWWLFSLWVHEVCVHFALAQAIGSRLSRLQTCPGFFPSLKLTSNSGMRPPGSGNCLPWGN